MLCIEEGIEIMTRQIEQAKYMLDYAPFALIVLIVLSIIVF